MHDIAVMTRVSGSPNSRARQGNRHADRRSNQPTRLPSRPRVMFRMPPPPSDRVGGAEPVMAALLAKAWWTAVVNLGIVWQVSTELFGRFRSCDEGFRWLLLRLHR